jgi:hypothetical protein
MTFNAYITLDGNRYAALRKSWKPVPVKASQDRLNLDGTRDVTYGPAAFVDYQGELVAATSPSDTAYGSYADLLQTIAKTESVSFTDHFGTTYYVHVLGPYELRASLPDWDSASNVWYVNVRIVSA